MTDDNSWNQSFDKLNRQLNQHERLIYLTREWCELTTTLNQQRNRGKNLITETPPAMREELNKNMDLLEQAQGSADAVMKKALSTGTRLEAVQAKGEIDPPIKFRSIRRSFFDIPCLHIHHFQNCFFAIN